MKQQKIILFSLFALVWCSANAQQKPNSRDTLLNSSTIEINQIYQPKIKEAVKDEYSPSLPPMDASPSTFEYQVPKRTLNYSYKPAPLQPLSLGRDTLKKGFDNYIKAGLGNLSTIYFDAGIQGFKSKNFNSVVHLGLLNQKGNIDFQKQTAAVLNAEGLYHFPDWNAKMNLDLQYNKFYQYGYDHTANPNKIANAQTLNGGAFKVNFFESGYDKNGFKEDFYAKVSAYTGSNILSEVSIQGGGNVMKKFSSEWRATAGIDAVVTSLQTDTLTINNNYASLILGALYSHKKLSGHAYIKPTIGQGNEFYWLHDVLFKYQNDQSMFEIGAGALGTLTQNTYQQLFQYNPFISVFPIKQTNSNEIFVYLKKGVGQHLSFNTRLSYWRYKNFTNYLNAYGASPEEMVVSYLPTLNALQLQFGADYQIGNKITVGAQFSTIKFSNIAANTKVLHTPNTKLSADLRWQVLRQLNVTAYMAFLGGNYAQDNNTLQLIKLNPILDMGFGAEYLAMKKLSFFVNFNNLLNNKYQRWQGYQTYGINIYGGLRFKF